MALKEFKINSIADLLKKLPTVCGPERTVWYRGHADHTWHLEPSLARLKKLESEAQLIKQFKQNAFQFLDKAPETEWEWIFLMQHYGVPTRLLDWTESALVALYFALYSRRAEQSSVPAVWALDPFALNSATLGDSTIVVPSELNLAKYLPKCGSDVQGQLPLAVHPEYADRRMNAQHSKFTMHGCVAVPLEDMQELQPLRNSGQRSEERR